MVKDEFAQARQLYERKARKQEKSIEGFDIDGWQTKWRERGPIRFAEELLTCPIDVPAYPNWQTLQTEERKCEACSEAHGEEIRHRKFRENGIPYHIILSDDQKIFLSDIWKNGVKQALIAAGRSCGKSFVLAIFNCWFISTAHEKKGITCMGGSGKQSELVQSYIDEWRVDTPILRVIIYKSLTGIVKKCVTIKRSKCEFPACSQLSARGPHVSIVEIDEACQAEDKSEEGAKAVAAVQWQTTGKRDTIVILSSTAHYIHGMFYEYMTKPEYGYKVYRWAIARHINGEIDPMKVYTDKDPSHWLPVVWWMTQEEIKKQRQSKSDEEWLCEALGGASMASGAVFKKGDLDICICTLCKETGCEPYKWGYCKLVELAKTGTEEDTIKYIGDRVAGFDYGVSEAPCALTVLGIKENMVFILYNHEEMGLREEEKVSWVDENCRKLDTWIIIPDPAIGGKHLNESWEEKGYAVYIIAESDKMARVFNLINHVEKHVVMIPMAFWYLTQSLRKLCWDKDGKIRKVADHSVDALCYALNDHMIEEYDVFETLGSKSMPKTDEIFK